MREKRFEKRQNRDDLELWARAWSQVAAELPDDERSVLELWRNIRHRCDVYIAFLDDTRKGDG